MNGIGISYLLLKPVNGSDLLLLTQSWKYSGLRISLERGKTNLNKVEEELGVSAIARLMSFTKIEYSDM